MKVTATCGRSVWVILIMVCLVAPGCSRTRSASQEVRLIASSRPYEADVPIPVGFKLVDEASEDRSTGVSRLYLRHLYRGRADKHAVRSFYRQQMPLARWIKVSDGSVAGRITLRFEKGNESCTIDIHEAGSGLKACTEVQVLVSQEQRGAATGGTLTKRNGT